MANFRTAGLKGCRAVLCSGCLTLSSVLRTTPPSRQSRARQHQAAFGCALQPLTDPSDSAVHRACSHPCAYALAWYTAK